VVCCRLSEKAVNKCRLRAAVAAVSPVSQERQSTHPCRPVLLKCDSPTNVVSWSMYVQRVSLAVAVQLRSAVRADVCMRSNTPCPLPALVYIAPPTLCRRPSSLLCRYSVPFSRYCHLSAKISRVA